MRIAVSSGDKSIDGDVFAVFGRCPYFIIIEIEDQKIGNTEAIKNESIDQSSGAGITAAQLMAEKDVNAIITKNVGPRALDVLKQFNIEVYSGEGSISGVIQEFIDGKLEKIDLS